MSDDLPEALIIIGCIVLVIAVLVGLFAILFIAPWLSLLLLFLIGGGVVGIGLYLNKRNS